MSMTVIKRSGEEVVFDVSKIVAAITKALESLLPKIEEAVQSVSQAMASFAAAADNFTAPLMDSLQQTAYAVAHRLLHFMVHCYYSARSYVSRVITYDPRSAVYYAATVCVTIRILTLEYIEHDCASRRSNLFRRQDRGSTDSVSDNDNLILIMA